MNPLIPVVLNSNGLNVAIKNVATRALFSGILFIFCIISGCATNSNANPTDPFEKYNRNITTFNDAVDRVALKPVATVYRDVTPYLVRKGVSNFFDNLEDAWSFVNGVLQLRPVVATDNFMRTAVNTFFGMGGVLDIASEMGIERHSEDLGKTMGRWGVPSGPYIVLPIMGPTTLRDALTIIAESKADPVSQTRHIPSRNTLYTLRALDTRAELLPLTNFLDAAALDKYTFTRDAFLQKRRAEIYRPNQPEAEKAEDFSKEPTK